MQISENLARLVPQLSAQLTSPRPASWSEVLRAAGSLNPRIAEVLASCIGSIILTVPATEVLNDAEIAMLMSRAQSARNVIWRLAARRFPKLAYRLREAHHTGGDTEEQIASRYSQPEYRYELERKIESVCKLPLGSIFVHCPRRRTSLKVAEVLVVGSDFSKVAQLKDLTHVTPEGLRPYQEEILAVQEMYRSIWQFAAYLDLAYWEKQPVVEWALERELQFHNDRLLADELAREDRGAYGLLAGPLKDEIAPNRLSAVIDRIDAEVPARMRLGDAKEDLTSKLRKIINEVSAAPAVQESDQLKLPGMEPSK